MKQFMHFTILACVIQLLAGIWGYQMYQSRIPNGEIVPHPCKANYIWRGVGHTNALGGGQRNPFGLAFYAAGMRWTKDLCKLDSDGDGKTNGDELGDPNCVWTNGQVPSKVVGLSHPGVCEPMNSFLCTGKNAWVDCHVGEFSCNAINNNETMNLTVRFPVSAVPPKETTYKCMMFKLPQDGDYHLVANKAIIDNVNMMHHIIVYGCGDDENSTIPLNQPYDCFMSPARECTDIIGLWAVGVSGQCHHESSGFRIGVTGYKRAAFEFHWNNPALINGTTDSSGMTFYYTPKLRPNDAGVLMIGQTYLYIPPGETAVTAIGTCPGECTKDLMTGNINITTAVNHMHYLGIKQRIELLRNGSKVQNVTFDEEYSYDSPVIYNYDNPIEVRPGDELKTTCVFRSTSRYTTTYYGEDTSKEMCFGFLTYYPKSNFLYRDCSQWNSISICDWDKPEIQGCHYRDISNASNPQSIAIYMYVMENCSPLGKCQKKCLAVVKEIKNDSCFHGDIDKYLRFQSAHIRDPVARSQTLEFYAALDSCNVELALEAAGENYLKKNCTMLLQNNFTTLNIYNSVMENCDPHEEICRKECLVAVREIKKHPCFQGDMDIFMRLRVVDTTNPILKTVLLEFYNALDSCDIELAFESGLSSELQNNCTTLKNNVSSGADSAWHMQPLLLFLSILLCRLL
ncbi:hypothetical protein ACJMK2_038662 [Sinanodonta woodiana]|uniref:Temptin n=1 Tax=Sinanodonta woodiana TaxID=1069815 RepID=A0ABD3W9Q9_SINWO